MLPTCIEDLIRKYGEDMTLLELTPTPEMRDHEPVAVTLDTFIHMENTALEINELIVDSLLTNGDHLRNILLYQQVSQLIDFPMEHIYNFDLARIYYNRRCAIWGVVKTSICPSNWKQTIPYIIVRFIDTFDFQELQHSLSLWILNQGPRLLDLPWRTFLPNFHIMREFPDQQFNFKRELR